MRRRLRPPEGGAENAPVIPHLFSLRALKLRAIFFLKPPETGRIWSGIRGVGKIIRDRVGWIADAEKLFTQRLCAGARRLFARSLTAMEIGKIEAREEDIAKYIPTTDDRKVYIGPTT
jgi:hypothetical protein